MLPVKYEHHLHITDRRYAEIGFGGIDWIGMFQNRHKRSALVNTAMNLRVL
jgi:hypothetical protein